LTFKSEYKYLEADKFVVVNDNDPDLVPVKIALPPCPKIDTIDGYGLPPSKQKFQYQVMPDKLRDIEKRIRSKMGRGKKKKASEVTIDEIYDELKENENEYKAEILWIKKQIRRHYNGYWFFNNSKPTYMTGAHYTYLNWWPIGTAVDPMKFEKSGRDGLADYRDRDRRWFTAFHYSMTTTETVYRFKVQYNDGDGIEYKYFNQKTSLENFMKLHPVSEFEEDQFVRQSESGKRTLYGLIYPKHRREGATSRAGFLAWYVTATLGLNRFGGIQSLSDEHAYNVFYNHVSKRHRDLPFFLKLVTDGTSVPKEKISFTTPPTRTHGGTGQSDIPVHNGAIDYQASGIRAYDGTKLWYIFHDEVGKKEPEYNFDAYDRWNVCLKCLAQGPDVHGVGLLASTLGEMTAGGGEVMKQMILDSMWEKRDDNGHTKTKLMILFFPAQDGYDGFIDEFGMSVVDDPITPVKDAKGNIITIGAETYLMNQRAAFENEGQEDKLISLMQDFPMSLKECFMSGAKNSFMPVAMINKRISELILRPEIIKTGRFEWTAGRGSKVEFIPDKEGMYKVSYLQESAKRNLVTHQEHWFTRKISPTPTRTTSQYLTLGVDPSEYGSKEVEGKKKSFGAMTLYYSHDNSVDKTDGENPKPEDSWISEKFILTARNREMSPDAFADECLKVCMFYGALMYPEINKSNIFRYFIEWGYEGYLKYDVDPQTGEYALKPGYIVSSGATNTTKIPAIQNMEYYLRERVQWENHRDLLSECMQISSHEQMTQYDLFAAGCAALRGAQSNFVQKLEEQEEGYTFVDTMFQTYNYYA
jgi:hypothetical protein